MMRCCLLLVAVLVVGSPVAAQEVYFVDADATGANDGSSWADAFPDLQRAHAFALEGARLPSGVYIVRGGTPSAVLTRRITLVK